MANEHRKAVWGEWIPITERQPEDGQRAIFCYVDGGNISIEIGNWHTADRHFDWGGEYGFDARKITAWMPIPEPYNADQTVKPKTYAEILFEKFPNATRMASGCPSFCRDVIFGINSEDCQDKPCGICWNEPYPEEARQ